MIQYVDVEHDQYFLRMVMENTSDSGIAQFLKTAFDRAIAEKAVDFEQNVAQAINDCLDVGGIPQFRSRYAGQPFPQNTVLMICYGSRGRMKGVWLKNTPDQVLQELAAKRDGYRLMLARYGGRRRIRRRIIERIYLY